MLRRGNSVFLCIGLWLFGNAGRGIHPYRDLTPNDFGVYEVRFNGCTRVPALNVLLFCYRTYSTQAGPMLNLLTCLTNHRYFPLQLSALGARKLKPTTQTRRHSEWKSLFSYLLHCRLSSSPRQKNSQHKHGRVLPLTCMTTSSMRTRRLTAKDTERK
jgi:hypothetical protein